MPISIDSALGFHATALSLRAQRAELLASNLANADTPGYKAKDIDFKSVLARRQADGLAVDLTATTGGHITTASAGGVLATDLKYRIPNQSSLDGNTVDPHIEKAAFADNAVQYQTSLLLLDRKIRGLVTALRGD